MSETISVKITNPVVAYLIKNNLSCKQFADRSGIPLSTVHNFVRGTIPSKKNLIRLRDATKGAVGINSFKGKSVLQRCETCGSLLRKAGLKLGLRKYFSKVDGKKPMRSGSNSKRGKVGSKIGSMSHAHSGSRELDEGASPTNPTS